MKTTHFFLYTIFIGLIAYSCEQGPYKKAMDLNQKGTEYFYKGNDSALHYFELAIQADSTFQPAIQNKANFLIKKENYQEALETIDLLIAQRPYAEAWQFKGMILDITGQEQEAQKSYQNAIDQFNKQLDKLPNERKALTRLSVGVNYFLLGDTTKAKQLLTENKKEAKDLAIADSILNNLDDKERVIRLLLNKDN